MRFLLSLSGVALAALPTFASTENFVAEAPALIALIGYHTGEPVLKTLPNGSTEEVVSRHVFRIGMRELLEHLVEIEVIPSTMGWRIIAVWGDWSTSGKGYRFYLQNLRYRGELHPIPEEILHFERVDSATARKHTLAGDAIIGGSETYTSYAQLKVTLSSGTGTSNGLATSMDIYRRPPGYETAVYLPGPTKFSGTGIWESTDPDIPDSVLEGRFLVGGSRIVPSAPYAADLASTTSGVSTASGLTKASGATLILSGSTTYSGGITLTSGRLALPSSGLSGTVSTLTLSTGTALTWSPDLSAYFQTGLTVNPVLFESGTTITFDPSALSSGFVHTGGVLTAVP